jgi:hypothetical protein
VLHYYAKKDLRMSSKERRERRYGRDMPGFRLLSEKTISNLTTTSVGIERHKHDDMASTTDPTA